MEKLTCLYLAVTTFFASLFAQEGLHGGKLPDDSDFYYWVAALLAGAVSVVFGLYVKAVTSRISKLEDELSLYRTSLFNEFAEDKNELAALKNKQTKKDKS